MSTRFLEPTPFAGLNQWDAEDKPERVDFNADNKKIDAKLKELSEHISLKDQEIDATLLKIKETRGVWYPQPGGGIQSASFGTGHFTQNGSTIKLFLRVDKIILDNTDNYVTILNLPSPIDTRDILYRGIATWGNNPLIPHMRSSSGNAITFMVLNLSDNTLSNFTGKGPTGGSGPLFMQIEYETNEP